MQYFPMHCGQLAYAWDASSKEAKKIPLITFNLKGGVEITPVSSVVLLNSGAEVNLVTALVPSDTACLASSPGRMRRTAVWISREVTVGFLL